MMTISFCIPIFNRGKLLEKTMLSILYQTIDDSVGIVVSDNASTDNTQDLVKQYQQKYPNIIKYNENETNLGFYENTLIAITKATGEYLWLFSDDDVLLQGVADKVLSEIGKHNPSFVYMNHAGFLEDECHEVVLKRYTDLIDCVYDSGEDMILDMKRIGRVGHFSSTIYKKEHALKFIPVARQYMETYSRGYAYISMTHHLILESPGPFVFIGKICLAVRNPFDSDYDGMRAHLIDNARLFQNLYNQQLISEKTKVFLFDHFMKKGQFWRIILPARAKQNTILIKKQVDEIARLYKDSPGLYFHLYPVLFAPRPIIIILYRIGWAIRRIRRKISQWRKKWFLGELLQSQ